MTTELIDYIDSIAKRGLFGTEAIAKNDYLVQRVWWENFADDLVDAKKEIKPKVRIEKETSRKRYLDEHLIIINFSEDYEDIYRRRAKECRNVGKKWQSRLSKKTIK